MSGGNLLRRARCARRFSDALALLAALGIFGAAHQGAAAEAASARTGASPDQKSIVVHSGRVDAAEPDVDPDAVLATDADPPLEPISAVSDRVPDLADAPQPAVPTLADEYLEYATDAPTGGAPRKPAPQPEPQPTAAPAAAVVPQQAASFNGVTPGETTRTQVFRVWGRPAAEAPGGAAVEYQLANFPTVAIRFRNDVVSGVRVELAEAADAEALIDKLDLADVRPAVALDGSYTVFPERGVTFYHRASAAVASDSADEPADLRQVIALGLSPIEAAPFVLRAETTPTRDFVRRVADLEAALQLDSQQARARWLLSHVRLAVGAAVAAEALAAEAVELEPGNDEFRLQWARCLKALARYDEAVDQTRQVLENATVAPLVRAAALDHMGSLAALGSTEVQQRSVPLHTKAIELADTLADSDDVAQRLGATQLLIGAHLAIAERIAVGHWQDEAKYVGQWISRASALAEQLIDADEGDVSLRLQVAVGALAAGVKLDAPIDPAPWIAEVREAVAALRAEHDNPLAQGELNWQLALACSYAAEISHRRGAAAEALQWGQEAHTLFTVAAPARAEMPDTEFVVGRNCFQIGAVLAVHRNDHAGACQWYDRAIERLSQPAPVTPLATPGQHGDALVSMAVSYWETGDRDRAYELTGAGVELVEMAIDEGLLAADAIEVPRSNFVAMSRALGKSELLTPTTDQALARGPAATNPRPDAAAPQRTGQRTAVRTAPGTPVRRR